MEPSEVLELLFRRADTLQGYWNLLIAGTAAMLGLMASGKPFTQQRQMKVLLTIAFTAFAISNLVAILAVNDQRRHLGLLIPGKHPLKALAESAMPQADLLLIAFHITIDVLVILTIWFVHWSVRAHSRTPPSTD